MTAIAIFTIFALLAGTAYAIGVYGSRFGLVFEFEVDEETRRRRDAQKGRKIFGDIVAALQTHKEALTALMSVGRDAEAEADVFAERLAKHAKGTIDQTEQANQTLQAQIDQLHELTAAYGDLFENEQRNIESYCDMSRRLDGVLRAGTLSPEARKPADGELISEQDRLAMSLAGKLVRENEKLRSRISGCESQIELLMSDMSRLERETRTDSLTQLPNRRAWEERTANLSGDTPNVFVMLDLDEFKEINDAHGHYAGDGMLNLVATMIRNTSEVTGYRISGDEFALLVSERLWPRIGHILENLRGRVEKASLHDSGERIQVTVSIGAALALPGESTIETTRRADEALYVAKSAGGNRVHLSDDGRSPDTAAEGTMAEPVSVAADR